MKNIFKYLLIALSIAGFTACQDLTEIPYSFLTRENFYKSQTEIESAVNGAYQNLGSASISTVNSMMYLDALTDMSGAGTTNLLDNYSFDSENEFVAAFWENSYQIINRANEVLSNIEPIAFDNITNKNKAKGEALFLRAYFYLYLAMGWGDVPLRLEATLVPAPVAKSPQSKIFEQVIADLKDAETLLPLTSSPVGKPNSWTAKALLAKAYLYSEQWNASKTKALEVISSGTFGWLTGVYSDMWKTTNEATKNFIFSAQFNTAIQNSFSDQILPQEVNDHPCGKGLQRVKLDQEYLDSIKHQVGDDRAKWYSRDYLPGKTVAYGICEKFAILTGQKLLDDKKKGVNFPLYRYSDLVLVYAEAAARDNELITGVEYINKLRRRSYNKNPDSPDVSIDVSASTFDKFLSLLMRERYFEFGGEGQYWFDLTRTGRFTTITSPRGGSPSAKHRFLPIPNVEIIASDGVVEQNPLWK